MSWSRFHGRKTVINVIRKGEQKRASGFTVKKRSSNINRVAVVVSKKVEKRAVVRNRIRRRIKAAIYENLDIQNIGSVVIIVHSSDIAERDYQLLATQLSEAINS